MPTACRLPQRPASKERPNGRGFCRESRRRDRRREWHRRATCRAFAAQGARVAVLDRDASAAESVAGGIADRGGNATAHAVDVADRAAFHVAATKIAEAAGGIDVLVDGAGTTVRQLIRDMRPEDWDRVIAVNLTGAFNGIQAVLPHMRRRGGAIINVASIAGQRISFGGTPPITRRQRPAYSG
jgi:NAD(P)-dependent dehydrogenase (short-subunit alcohol dehydrogenase family)